jgi:hypothetical protein
LPVSLKRNVNPATFARPDAIPAPPAVRGPIGFYALLSQITIIQMGKIGRYVLSGVGSCGFSRWSQPRVHYHSPLDSLLVNLIT